MHSGQDAESLGITLLSQLMRTLLDETLEVDEVEALLCRLEEAVTDDSGGSRPDWMNQYAVLGHGRQGLPVHQAGCQGGSQDTP